jgi:hypothetical protein
VEDGLEVALVLSYSSPGNRSHANWRVIPRGLWVMLRDDRARHLDLHGLCSRERMIQAGALARRTARSHGVSS